MTSVTMNGNTYDNAGFLNGEYAGLFPLPVFADMMAELASREGAILGQIAGQDASMLTQINTLAPIGFVSLSSVAIGTGAKTFTLTQAVSALAGVYKVFSTANPANFMIVRLVAGTFSTTTFAVISDVASGSGTFADWQILNLSDQQRRGYRAIATAADITASDMNGIVECTAPMVLTATSVLLLLAGFQFTLVNSSAGNVTFDPEGGELVDGSAALVLPAGRSVTLLVTNAAWYVSSRLVRSHDIVTGHTASGLTAGHVLRALSATTFAFGAIQPTDLPLSVQRATRIMRMELYRRTRRVGRRR